MSNNPFYVIALGASAGGHKAVWEFFANLPPISNTAFVILHHLKADAISVADELLTKYTTIPITWAQDEQCLQPDHIYLLPPGKYMTLQDGKFRLIDRDPLRKINQAIDIFFRSLADQKGEYGIGIILSGSGSDGTKGAIYMHQRGGKVLAQDPNTADFSGMPLTAIIEDHAKLIGSPQDLAWRIEGLLNTLEKSSQ